MAKFSYIRRSFLEVLQDSQVVPSLLKRKKWYADQCHIQVGILFLVIDQNTPRGRWPISIVDEIYFGKDDILISAIVRNKGGTYHRPVSKLCVIEENQIVISENSRNEADDVPAPTV